VVVDHLAERVEGVREREEEGSSIEPEKGRSLLELGPFWEPRAFCSRALPPLSLLLSVRSFKPCRGYSEGYETARDGSIRRHGVKRKKGKHFQIEFFYYRLKTAISTGPFLLPTSKIFLVLS
jgi:hypothetical protein